MGQKPRFAAPGAPSARTNRRALLLLAKVRAAAAVSALLYWNVTILARLAKRVDSDSVGRLRGQAAAAPRESLDEEEAKPWFLQPEAYVKEVSCCAGVWGLARCRPRATDADVG
jgi:hypothetical protein